MKTLVVVPTYEEAQNVVHALDAIRRCLPSADILVVDDNSPDGTGEIVAAQAAADDRIELLRRTAKSGLGDAYRAGFAWALARGYEAIVEMDADGSHPATALPALAAGLASADLVLGSRWIRGGRVDGWAVHRRVLSQCASAFTRWMLRTPVHDVTSGFRAFRAETLHRIDVASTTSNGYSFQIETLHRAERSGLRISEVPITFSERCQGSSKMTIGIIREAVRQVAGWRRRPYEPRLDAPR